MDFIRKAVIFMMLYCSAMSILWILGGEPVAKQFKFHRKYKLVHYFVNTEGCVIPIYNAFDKTMMKFFSKPKHLNCDFKVPWTTQNNMTLNLVRKESDVSYCEYQEIIRPPKNDGKFTYSQSTNFTHSVKINSEFIRVTCYDKHYKKQYTNFHAFVPRSQARVASLDEKLTKHKKLNKPKENLNVFLIGIDSLSRLNHIRHMPKTRNFLLQNLSAIDFQGYTKLADNTYVNIVPLTTGNFVGEENRRIAVSDAKGPYDNYNLIWKNYSNNGYSTLLAEDCAPIQTFNFLKKGFADKPVDHYIRPFSLAAEKGKEAWHKGRSCIWNRSETKAVLDYSLEFLRTYKDRPHFGYTFISRLTHSSVQNAAYADDEYYNFLLTLHKHGLLQNTVLFFFSDHGMRYGSILKTDIGQIELRMPTMYIVLPPWFKERYSDIYQNLLNNKNSLTSPFDIYETLKDILHFTGKPRQNIDAKQRGISLFDPIPETRTCENAGILPQWCVCKMKEITLKENGDVYRSGVNYVLNVINYKVRKYSACVKRKLKTVSYAKLFTNEHKRGETTNNKTTVSRMVIIKAMVILTPDNAEFEATLKYNESNNKFRLAGGISRNNLYGHTADCVQDSNVRKFCYCRHSTTFRTSSSTSVKSVTNTPGTTFKPVKPRPNTSHKSSLKKSSLNTLHIYSQTKSSKLSTSPQLPHKSRILRKQSSPHKSSLNTPQKSLPQKLYLQSIPQKSPSIILGKQAYSHKSSLNTPQKSLPQKFSKPASSQKSSSSILGKQAYSHKSSLNTPQKFSKPALSQKSLRKHFSKHTAPQKSSPNTPQLSSQNVLDKKKS